MIKRKRAYDTPDEQDGFRVLVDRLWPRGVSKEEAHLDLWLKEVAPSTDLRKWFDHDPKKWDEFRRRYEKELADRKDDIALLREKARDGVLTLVYGAKDTEHNQAVVLEGYLKRRAAKS